MAIEIVKYRSRMHRGGNMITWHDGGVSEVGVQEVCSSVVAEHLRVDHLGERGGVIMPMSLIGTSLVNSYEEAIVRNLVNGFRVIHQIPLDEEIPPSIYLVGYEERVQVILEKLQFLQKVILERTQGSRNLSDLVASVLVGKLFVPVDMEEYGQFTDTRWHSLTERAGLGSRFFPIRGCITYFFSERG